MDKSIKNLSFKYYPATILFFLVCMVIGFILFIKYIILHFFENLNFIQIPLINIIIDIVGLSGTLSLFFILINKYFMYKWYLKILGIPNLKGKYKGELISSYKDKEIGTNKIKYVELKISQNLNGFYVKTFIFENKNDKYNSSSSYSISHDILPIDNGEFLITYLYNNTGNTLNKELNPHIGFSMLTFNPKNKTLQGNYFNNASERKSYGTLDLKRK